MKCKGNDRSMLSKMRNDLETMIEYTGKMGIDPGMKAKLAKLFGGGLKIVNVEIQKKLDGSPEKEEPTEEGMEAEVEITVETEGEEENSDEEDKKDSLKDTVFSY